jgi:hypothetical protein
MENPTLTDYVSIICTLFERFEQERQQKHGPKRGRPLTYTEESFLIFFLLMQFRRIYQFKSQRRWLENHPDILTDLGWKTVPHRTQISRRYKQLYDLLQAFSRFVAQYASSLDELLSLKHLVADESLFKAKGPVWHQSDRKVNRIPDKLRNLDTDATWSKSGYHGWVYGYGLHVLCNEEAFPVLAQVETGAVSESKVIDQQAALILDVLRPDTVAADNGYTKALRIRRWAKRGVALLTPAIKWVKGRYAEAYHRFIQEPDIKAHLDRRKTNVEPLFDLVAKVLGTDGPQKQLSVQGLRNVRTCLSLGLFSVQIAMIVNCIWGLPLRTISVMQAVFT